MVSGGRRNDSFPASRLREFRVPMSPYKWLAAAAFDPPFLPASRNIPHHPPGMPAHTIPSTKRAGNVCHACMSRKKACDKALPACGFCFSRQLHCRYDISVQKSHSRRRYNPGRHFVAIPSPSPPSVSDPGRGISRPLRSLVSGQDDTHTRWSSLYTVPQASLEDSLNRVAQSLINSTNFTYDGIVERYFAGFHTSFPIISPGTLRREASLYREEGRLPSADFTVLLVAILLILSPPIKHSLLAPGVTREILYTTAKTAFFQAQASITTSLRLVQAAVLITLREYTGGRADAAYVSIMTCLGMARISGITTAMLRTRDVETEGDFRVDTLERENVTWAIAMLERYDRNEQIHKPEVEPRLKSHVRLILCEMAHLNVRAQTEYPGPECRLPSDLRPATDLNYRPDPNVRNLHQGTFSSLPSLDAGHFGRQAQALALLDRLLTALHFPDSNPEAKLAELTDLDGKIRRFLESILEEGDWKHKLHCVPAAMCVR